MPTDTIAAQPTNLKLISTYFKVEGERLADFSAGYKALTDVDKEQLGEGLRNGSLTY